MKKLYIKDLLKKYKDNYSVELSAWIKSKRIHGNVIFIDLVDSTGEMQAVVSSKNVSTELFEKIRKVAIESAVEIKGILVRNQKDNNLKEIEVYNFEIIGPATLSISPSPRSDFDIFDPKYADHVLRNRHLYIRNPKLMSILRFRHIFMNSMRQWFNENEFTEICAPVLTPIPLYDNDSAMQIEVHDEKVFLTQCVGYYLEACAHAFEKVYNMGPSFRGEESRSKRHLMEYWHIKAEIAFGNRDDIIEIVESIISYVTQKCAEESKEIMQTLGTGLCLDGLKIPYARISYAEAIEMLRKKGEEIEFGESLGSGEEALLSEMFTGPFWIVGIPKSIEPFPYCLDPSNNEITLVADLIASNGYGELLGVAEKISNIEMLDQRMKDKGKADNPKYEWVRDIHQVGCVPHIAFGMGVERMIRWFLNIDHVRDAIPFPRTFRRNIYP